MSGVDVGNLVREMAKLEDEVEGLRDRVHSLERSRRALVHRNRVWREHIQGWIKCVRENGLGASFFLDDLERPETVVECVLCGESTHELGRVCENCRPHEDYLVGGE